MGVRVLLVDDSEELVNAYVAFLQATTPWEIRTAASGREALRLIRTWRPDVVVTDIMIPDMSGLDLISHIRSELAPPLPAIIAMSGFPDVEPEVRRRGADIFQPKPIDTEDLLTLIESLLTHRAPSDGVRARTQARRRELAEAARAAVATALADRPHYREAARLGMRLLSRYFGDADAAILLVAENELEVFASSGWSLRAHPEGIPGYVLDVVVSGSTLIVPDLGAVPEGAPFAPVRDWRLFAAVPLRMEDGLAVGALALADRRPLTFDVHDLAILDHIARRLGAVFSGREGAAVLHGPGILTAASWQHLLGCEVKHLGDGATLVVALASLPCEDGVVPGSSREQVDAMQRAVDKLVDRLPARTALGRLGPETLAAYSLVEDPAIGERAFLSILAALEGERRACAGILSATGLRPTDGGAALLGIARWLLDSALARGPATTLQARLVPTPLAAAA